MEFWKAWYHQYLVSFFMLSGWTDNLSFMRHHPVAMSDVIPLNIYGM